jgi:hypothetical protein
MIRWVQKDGSAPDCVTDVSEEIGGDDGALLIGGPDWVIAPPELGGQKLYIRQRGWVDMSCPKCAALGPIYVMILDGDLSVACCAHCKGYLWFNDRP